MVKGGKLSRSYLVAPFVYSAHAYAINSSHWGATNGINLNGNVAKIKSQRNLLCGQWLLKVMMAICQSREIKLIVQLIVSHTLHWLVLLGQSPESRHHDALVNAFNAADFSDHHATQEDLLNLGPDPSHQGHLFPDGLQGSSAATISATLLSLTLPLPGGSWGSIWYESHYQCHQC